jgi:hypothetical protein
MGLLTIHFASPSQPQCAVGGACFRAFSKHLDHLVQVSDDELGAMKAIGSVQGSVTAPRSCSVGTAPASSPNHLADPEHSALRGMNCRCRSKAY